MEILPHDHTMRWRRSISKGIAIVLILTFSTGQICPFFVQAAWAQATLVLPPPGTRVTLSAAFHPPILRGLRIHPENPLRFDFIVDSGDNKLTGKDLEEETIKLIKYFLASITIPEDETWVNLSPYEQDRVVPEGFGTTEMGRDMLAQDYILKQMTASLMFPEDKLGSAFWQRVYARAQELYGTTSIPINTFNKVWIVPDRAVVVENEGVAFVGERHLKVMLEEDYVSLTNNMERRDIGMNRLTEEKAKAVSGFTSDVVREVLIPELEKEVNEGAHFAKLRQIFNSMILATWFKKNLRKSLLGQVYMDQNKVRGIDLDDKNAKEQIYQQYLEAFKTGVYNYIKEDYDPGKQKMIRRKYFSGGIAPVTQASLAVTNLAEMPSGSVEKIAIAEKSQQTESNDGDLQNFVVDLLENGDNGQPVRFQPGMLTDNQETSAGIDTPAIGSPAITTQDDLNNEIISIKDAINRGEIPADTRKFIKVAPTGILLASASHPQIRYRPGSPLATYVIEADGTLKAETTWTDGKIPIVSEDSVIMSNGDILYPAGHPLVGQPVKGRYKDDGTFDIDQVNGSDILQNEYLTDVGYVKNPSNYGITPTTKWQFGSKTTLNYVVQIPATAEGDFAVATNNGTRMKIKAGDYVVFTTKKGQADDVQGVQASQFNVTYVDYGDYMSKLGTGIGSAATADEDISSAMEALKVSVYYGDKEKDGRIQREKADALLSLGEAGKKAETAIPLIVETYKKTNGWSDELRSGSLAALASMGTPLSIQTLIDLLKEQSIAFFHYIPAESLPLVIPYIEQIMQKEPSYDEKTGFYFNPRDQFLRMADVLRRLDTTDVKPIDLIMKMIKTIEAEEEVDERTLESLEVYFEDTLENLVQRHVREKTGRAQEDIILYKRNFGPFQDKVLVSPDPIRLVNDFIDQFVAFQQKARDEKLAQSELGNLDDEVYRSVLAKEESLSALKEGTQDMPQGGQTILPLELMRSFAQKKNFAVKRPDASGIEARISDDLARYVRDVQKDRSDAKPYMDFVRSILEKAPTPTTEGALNGFLDALMEFRRLSDYHSTAHLKIIESFTANRVSPDDDLVKTTSQILGHFNKMFQELGDEAASLIKFSDDALGKQSLSPKEFEVILSQMAPVLVDLTRGINDSYTTQYFFSFMKSFIQEAALSQKTAVSKDNLVSLLSTIAPSALRLVKSAGREAPYYLAQIPVFLKWHYWSLGQIPGVLDMFADLTQKAGGAQALKVIKMISADMRFDSLEVTGAFVSAMAELLKETGDNAGAAFEFINSVWKRRSYDDPPAKLAKTISEITPALARISREAKNFAPAIYQSIGDWIEAERYSKPEFVTGVADVIPELVGVYDYLGVKFFESLRDQNLVGLFFKALAEGGQEQVPWQNSFIKKMMGLQETQSTASAYLKNLTIASRLVMHMVNNLSERKDFDASAGVATVVTYLDKLLSGSEDIGTKDLEEIFRSFIAQSEIFKGQGPMSGRLYLNVKEGVADPFVVEQFFSFFTMDSQTIRGFYGTDSHELGMRTAASPFTLNAINRSLINLGVFKRLGLDEQLVLWQPNLSLTQGFEIKDGTYSQYGSFWRQDGELREEAKILALVIRLTRSIAFSSGWDILYNPVLEDLYGKRQVARLWGTLNLLGDSEDFAQGTAFYGVLGNALITYFDHLEHPQKIQTPTDQKVSSYIENFLTNATELLTQARLKDVLVTSWKEENYWAGFRDQLREIEKLKNSFFVYVRNLGYFNDLLNLAQNGSIGQEEFERRRAERLAQMNLTREDLERMPAMADIRNLLWSTQENILLEVLKNYAKEIGVKPADEFVKDPVEIERVQADRMEKAGQVYEAMEVFRFERGRVSRNLFHVLNETGYDFATIVTFFKEKGLDLRDLAGRDGGFSFNVGISSSAGETLNDKLRRQRIFFERLEGEAARRKVRVIDDAFLRIKEMAEGPMELAVPRGTSDIQLQPPVEVAASFEGAGQGMGSPAEEVEFTQDDLDKRIAEAIALVNKAERPPQARTYVDLSPTGILMASAFHAEKRYQPGSALVTYVMGEKGHLSVESTATVTRESVILSNGVIQYPAGHPLAGQSVRGRYNDDGTFVIDQEKGADTLKNEWVSSIDYVENQNNYDITPTTSWQYGVKTTPNPAFQIPAGAKGDFVVTTGGGTKIHLKGGDFIVINTTAEGQVTGVKGVQATQFKSTYMDYEDFKEDVSDGTLDSPEAAKGPNLVTAPRTPQRKLTDAIVVPDLASLWREISAQLPAPSVDQIRRAYKLTLEIHEGQTREDGRPYVVHLVGVVKDLIQRKNVFGRLASPEDVATTIAAAFLHDAVEDATKGVYGESLLEQGFSDEKIRGEVERRIFYGVGPDVLHMVKEVTKGADEAEDQYLRDFIKEEASLGARLIKYSDLTFNMNDMYGVSNRAWTARFVRNRLPAVLDLLRGDQLTPVDLKLQFLNDAREIGKENNERNKSLSFFDQTLTDEQEQMIQEAIREFSAQPGAFTPNAAGKIGSSAIASNDQQEQRKPGGVAGAKQGENLGGIDLNAGLLNLQIKRDGNGVPLPVFDQPIRDMKIDGFVPVIISVSPVTGSMLLASNTSPQESRVS